MPYYQELNEYWLNGGRSGGPNSQSIQFVHNTQAQIAHAAALAQWGFHMSVPPNGQQMSSIPFGSGNSSSGGGSGSNRRSANSNNQMPGAGSLSGSALVGINGNLSGMALTNLQQQQQPPPHLRKWRKSNGGPPRNK